MTISAASLFEIQNRENFSLVRFFGFIDASTVEKTKPALQESIPARCTNIILDLSQVSFLDSHGVGLFVSLLKRAHKQGGKVVFAGAEGQPAAVLQMVGFNNALVTYCADINEAIALFGPQVSKAFGS